VTPSCTNHDNDDGGHRRPDPEGSREDASFEVTPATGLHRWSPMVEGMVDVVLNIVTGAMYQVNIRCVTLT